MDFYNIFSLTSCQSIDDLDELLRRLCDYLLSGKGEEEGPASAGDEDEISQVVQYMKEHFHIDRKGKPWMIFCHEWVQAGDGEVLAMPLTEDLKAAAGEPRLMFRASDAVWTKEMAHSSGIRGRVTDGPFLWRNGQGRLFCLWSSFSEDGYTQGLAESDNREITGHFRQLPPLFREDGGHGMLFRTREGKTLLTLHRPNRHLEEHPVFLPVDIG